MSGRASLNGKVSAKDATSVRRARNSTHLSNGRGFSADRIADRVAAIGKEITRDCKGRRLDVVITLDRGFVFAADLIRRIDAPVVCHFVRENVRDVEDSGRARREVIFETRPDLKGRDVVLVDAVLDSGVTQEFLLRRLGECQPRSLRLAVLLDKQPNRRVNLDPDYFGFRTASNDMWMGYGLAGTNGAGRNQSGLTSFVSRQRQRPKAQA
jgi:hypoxanthine phosphoribosyltransferase